MSRSTAILAAPVRPPTVAIIDVRLFSQTGLIKNFTELRTQCYYFPIMQAIREVTGKEIPILNWYSGSALFNLRIFGPEKLGGLGNGLEKAHSLAETTGKHVDEVAKEV